jgi:hypothetical protein
MNITLGDITRLLDHCFYHACHLTQAFPPTTPLPRTSKVIFNAANSIKMNELSFTVDLRFAYILFEHLLTQLPEKDERVLLRLLGELNSAIVGSKNV